MSRSLQEALVDHHFIEHAEKEYLVLVISEASFCFVQVLNVDLDLSRRTQKCQME